MRCISNLVCGFGIVVLSACGGGGSEGGAINEDVISLFNQEGGGACGALNARSASEDRVKLVNGETCNQEARTPVVAIYPVLSNGRTAGICTGTLVTVDDIVTSAHCFTQPFMNHGENLVSFIVQVGGENGEVIELSDLAIHPFYDGSVGSRYDIAMATLERVPSPRIGPVPLLLSKVTVPGQRMSTFGYGTNNDESGYGVLKSAELEIADIIDGNLLVTVTDNDTSICGGDSGGPVVQIADGVTTLVGVNSFGLFPLGVCPDNPALLSGFVDIQHGPILEFIGAYAPDVPII